MLTNVTDLNEAREARDLAFVRTFQHAFDTANELSELLRSTVAGADTTISYDLLQRATLMLSYCAGYSAGACPTENLRTRMAR